MAVPARLGPFQLARELSRGAMGAVYEAVHVDSGSRYALKVILDEGLGGVDPDMVERFRRESEALGQLNHPHVVRVHAADLAGPIPYMVQDLLPGGTLSQRMRDGPLPVEEATSIALKVADGLAAAHALGILHRDLKPDNVMFDDRGEPRLVDFGLARDLADTERLTRTGDVLGTPTFMAPEQARGSRGDARSDVYGLGGVLFAMLTGRPPIEPKGSVLMVLSAVTTEKIPAPRSLRPDVPDALSRVCVRALDKDPARRFDDARGLADALAAAARGEAPAASRTPLIAGAVVALLAFAVGVPLALREVDADAAGVSIPEVRELTPAERADAKRGEARDALLANDPVAALAAVDAGEPLEPRGALEWKRLRGLAFLLQGKLDEAEEALRGSPAYPAVAHERTRLALLSRARGEVSLEAPQDGESLFRDLGRFAEAGKVLRERKLVGPELLRRSQETVISVVLEFGETFYRGRREECREVLKAAHALSPDGPGAAAVDIGWACLMFETDSPLIDELEGRVDAGLDEERLGERWKQVGLVLRYRLERPHLGREPEDMPKIDGATLSGVERDMVQGGYRMLVDAWNASLVHSLVERSPQQAVISWRNALEFCRRRQRATSRTSQAWESANLNLVRLHLFALQREEAEKALAVHWTSYFTEVAYLRLEVALLKGDVGNLYAAKQELSGMVREYPRIGYLRCLRAAICFRSNRPQGGHQDLLVLKGMTDRVEFSPSLRRCAWRTGEETLLEANSDPQAMRARLAAALERYPAD